MALTIRPKGRRSTTKRPGDRSGASGPSEPCPIRLAPDGSIALGGAVDPYDTTEKRTRRTRRVLETFRELQGLTLLVTTSSDLVRRDRELLGELASRHRVVVSLSIPTLDRRLSLALDPEAPRPDLRLKALSELASSDVPVGVLVEPVIPWITDDPAGLDRLAGAAAGAGASWLSAGAIFPMPSELAILFPRLEEAFPDLVDRYRERYERSACVPAGYRAGLADLIERLRRKHGLTMSRCLDEAEPRAVDRSQLSLL